MSQMPRLILTQVPGWPGSTDPAQLPPRGARGTATGFAMAPKVGRVLHRDRSTVTTLSIGDPSGTRTARNARVHLTV